MKSLQKAQDEFRVAVFDEKLKQLAALTAERDVLLRIKEAAINLQSRLDEHFGGFVDESDWKEQAELRAALKAAK
jgi:hypothetical protein